MTQYISKLPILDTIETKEVDLVKEINKYKDIHGLHTQDGGRIVFANGDTPNFLCDFRDIAKHFFELGLKEQKGEKTTGLIDKIRAEVEKKTYMEQGFRNEDSEYGYRTCARDILSFLDTLEAKEDLETFDKEVTKMWGRCAANPNDTIACLHIDSFIEIARHFYELGLKAQKGE